MISGVLEGGVALLVAIATAIFIFGQMRENAKRNKEDISDIKRMIYEYQEGVQKLVAKSMEDVKQMLDIQRDHTRENLSREILHIKDLISISNNETREDIKRLEAAQKESNRIKERLAIAESSLKSLHHRLDIEPTIISTDKGSL